MSRAAHPQISFADWELMRQGLVLEPVLQAIADFLDDHEEMIEAIRADLRRGLKNPDTGRSGLTAQQVLRSLIVMRVKNWDYRELRERIADGYTLRQFTGFYCQPVPKHDAFNRGFNRLTPDTLQSRQRLVGSSCGRSWIGGRHEAACRHHGRANRHSSPGRQHVIVGCGARRHAPGWPPRQSAGAPMRRSRLLPRAGGSSPW